MKVINSTTKAGSRFVQMYKVSNYHSVSEAYKVPSEAKVRADRWCVDMMTREGGRGYRVISFNTFNFSVAWRTAAGLRVETPTNSFLVTL
nr:MAG TPA: hypothetical protein [Caudoviricetes sp.]